MTIHDHMDGSAHCIECKGPCKLTGEDCALSAFVRFALERSAIDGRRELWSFQVDALKELVGQERARTLWQRAKAATR